MISDQNSTDTNTLDSMFNTNNSSLVPAEPTMALSFFNTNTPDFSLRNTTPNNNNNNKSYNRTASLAFLAQDLLNEVDKYENSATDDIDFFRFDSKDDNIKNEKNNDNTTTNKNPKSDRKRKQPQSGDAVEKSNKKSKTQYQRKNIKKIIGEDKLNDATLKALKEEQERQSRLNKDIILGSTDDIGIKLESNYPNVSANSSLNKSSDQSVQIIDDDPGDRKLIKQESCVEIEDLTNDADEIDDNDILIDESESTKKSMYNDDDDDCRILSESEQQQEEQAMFKRQHRGIHMNDDLNIPDANGQVMVNVNHPIEDNDIYLLPYLARNIKSHQIGGIRFIYDNIVESLTRVKDKASGFGCILAHAMGLGKTFQIISFIEVFLRCTESKRVLCIVPINTIQNWLSEFNSWLPENGMQKLDNDTIINYKRPFKVHLINDFAKTLKQRTEIVFEWKENGGVLLIGYEMFRTLVTNIKPANTKSQQSKKQSNKKTEVIDLEEEDQLMSKQGDLVETLLTPCLVVCDEGHRIKNSSANIAKTLQRIKTKRRVVLTGYPLQNNLIEYWCMVDFVRPSYLGTKSEFSNMFERPIMNGQCMDSTREDIKLMRYRAHVLHSLLEGFVQRRGHDVFLMTLPQKREYIILLKLSPIQKELYLAFMEAIGAMNTGEKVNPLRSFAICCKIWNHPDVLHRYHINKESEIDLDLPDLQPQTNTKKPGKSASATTISAPSSANIIQEGGFNPFGASFNDSRGRGGFDPDWSNKLMEIYKPDILENGAKFLVSFSLIEQSVLAGDKLLLFSQSLLTLNLIEEYLNRINVPNTSEKWQKYKNYYRLDGSTPGIERERLINAFNNQSNNQVWLFLLSTRAGCLGINLIGANRVIVLDASWNPCHDAQAVCRVYRYGQKKNCYIYRLIADHTMEKKIYDRQISKQTMSDRVIDEIQSENHFTRTEVEKLIHYVKEDVPSADLSEITEKFDDTVLVNSCLQNSKFITKEPFTHESLLIDKKEYKLSDREKALAFKEYQHDKKYFPYSRANSSNNLLYQRFPQNHQQLLQSQMMYSNFYNQQQNHPSGLNHSVSSLSLMSSSSSNYLSSSSSSSSSPFNNTSLNNNINNNNNIQNDRGGLDFNLHKSLSTNSFLNKTTVTVPTNNNCNNNYNQINQNSNFARYQTESNTSNNNQIITNSSSLSSDIYVTNNNYNQIPMNTYNSNNNNNNVCNINVTSLNSTSSSPSSLADQSNQPQFNLKDVKITSFVAPSQIVIPPQPDHQQQNVQPIIINQGEKVFILKTPKGCYLRTPDKKYIALRNKTLQDSFQGFNFSNSPTDDNQRIQSSPSTSSLQHVQSPVQNYNMNYQQDISNSQQQQQQLIMNQNNSTQYQESSNLNTQYGNYMNMNNANSNPAQYTSIYSDQLSMSNNNTGHMSSSYPNINDTANTNNNYNMNINTNNDLQMLSADTFQNQMMMIPMLDPTSPSAI